MKARILYGSVLILNTKTNRTETVKEIIHVEGTDLESERNYILRKKPYKERKDYKLLKFNTQTAKQIGRTMYEI